MGSDTLTEMARAAYSRTEDDWETTNQDTRNCWIADMRAAIERLIEIASAPEGETESYSELLFRRRGADYLRSILEPGNG